MQPGPDRDWRELGAIEALLESSGWKGAVPQKFGPEDAVCEFFEMDDEYRWTVTVRWLPVPYRSEHVSATYEEAREDAHRYLTARRRQLRING